MGDGIALLRSLKITFHGNLTLLEVLRLQGRLLNPGIHFRGKIESVDTYAARTLQIHRKLHSNRVDIVPHILKACFICGLGPEFTDTIRHLNNNSLPVEWLPTSITDLLEPARQVLCLAKQQREQNANYKAQTTKQQQAATNSTTKSQSRIQHAINTD